METKDKLLKNLETKASDAVTNNELGRLEKYSVAEYRAFHSGYKHGKKTGATKKDGDRDVHYAIEDAKSRIRDKQGGREAAAMAHGIEHSRAQGKNKVVGGIDAMHRAEDRNYSTANHPIRQRAGAAQVGPAIDANKDADEESLYKLEKKFGISPDGMNQGSAGPPRLGYPAHPEGSNVSQSHSEESALVEPKLTPEEQEYPASDDHDKDSTNLPVNEGKRPKGFGASPGAVLDDLEDAFRHKAARTPGRSMAGAAGGALTGLAVGGPLGALAGGLLGHHLQHGQSRLAGSEGDSAKPPKESSAMSRLGQAAKPGVQDAATSLGHKVGQAAREATGAKGSKKNPVSMSSSTTHPKVQSAINHLDEKYGKPKQKDEGTGTGTGLSDGLSADSNEPMGRPVFVVPRDGKLVLHEAIKVKEKDYVVKNIKLFDGKYENHVFKGIGVGTVGGGALGYLMGGPLGALAGGLAGHSLMDDAPEKKDGDKESTGDKVRGAAMTALPLLLDAGQPDDGGKQHLVVPDEQGNHHHYEIVMDDESPMTVPGQESKTVTGAAAGAYMGYMMGGAMGAMVGGYLGHKIPGSKNPKPTEATTKDDGYDAPEEGSHQEGEESPEEAEERRKKQVNENIGGGLEQKPATDASQLDPHSEAMMADFAKQGLSKREAHLASLLKSGKKFHQVYFTKCAECRALTMSHRQPAHYFKSLAQAIDTGIVALGGLPPTDITRFHKEKPTLERVLKNGREV